MSTVLNLIELRNGDGNDLALVDTLMREAFDPRYGEAWNASQTSGMMALPGIWLTLATLNGTSAGFALSRSILEDAELLLLAVRPSMRGRGVGRALLRSVIHDARERGATQLHIEVRAGNDAIHLYQHEGFVKLDERPRYYRGANNEQFDAHSYTRPLD